MLTDEEIAEIHTFFKLKGYTWYTGEHKHLPSITELKAMLETLGRIVDEEDEDRDASSGKLLIKKFHGHREVWIYAGELNESD